MTAMPGHEMAPPLLKVVVIDDTPLVLARLKSLVRTIAGCQVVAFDTALDAVCWCEDGDPDLLIVDYMLPDIDGLECVRRVRLIPGMIEVPVIMVTQNHEQAIRNLALQSGVTDFLT
jgi:putative two-component system response regulator